MHAILKSTLLAVLLALLFPGLAEAGEVVLAGGDVLHGKVWKEDGVVHVDHPALGLIKLSPRHYKSATLDAPEEGGLEKAAAADPLTGLARPILCDPPALVDPKLTPKCKSPWHFAIGAGLSLDGGNTDKQKYNYDIDIAYSWRKKNRLTFKSFTFYEYANGLQTEGKYDALLRYERDLNARTYVFGQGMAHRDDFADILLRTGWFAGVGRHFIKRKKETLKGEIGAGAGTENREGIPAFSTPVLYAGGQYHREFRRGDYFDATAWVMPYLDHTGLSPSRLQLQYGHPLRDHLDITASFLLDYVPDPPPGIRSSDTKFVIGLRWRPTDR